MSLFTGIVLILCCVAIQFFFAGTEMGLISCNRIRLRHRRERGDQRAGILERFLANPKELFGTTLVGTNVAIVLASSLASFVVARYLHGNWQTIVTTIIMWPLVLFFGQIVPMSIFRQNADSLTLHMARPLLWSYWLLLPLVKLSTLFSYIISRLLTGARQNQQVYLSREELRLLLDETSSDSRAIMSEIFDLAGTQIREIMVPLVQLVAVPETATVEEIERRMQQSGFSRLPVYRQRVDNIVGVLHLKDVSLARPGQQATNLMVNPMIVPETQLVSHLLWQFLQQSVHLAVVVNEYGGVTGIVTMEDVVEELVGEIQDEHDRATPLIKIASGMLIVDGNTRVAELNEKFSLDLPESENYETIAGLVVHQLGHIPQKHEQIRVADQTLTVLEATDRKVCKLRIMPAVTQN